MTKRHSGGADRAPGRAPGRQRSILPLPEDVVAQIKSSTAIVSLTDVVLDLVKNALDAGATKVEATVDFARGGCSVEDDGLGIAPCEFRDDGGLGKLHCTSKYYSEEACFGRNGTFLASLAAMSLLTLVSRHHEHRSHNLITFHHSKPVDRQLPAQPQHELHEKHGTRVTVRNLFGNLPVRVKHRALLAEQKTEHDRLWELLRREVVGLFLSWRGQASLKIRDVNGTTSLAFANKAPRPCLEKSPSSELSSMLNVLTQANYISADAWPSWVPAAASTSSITIEGAISLDPAPTRRVQFISLGTRPLSAEPGHNELYDEINRIFSLSSFGTVEDDVDVDENEKIRRKHDKRFKHNGYTNRQLKARKGVDRYPMFHLRISPKSHHSFKQTKEHFVNDETNLPAVMEVLNAMIAQWLSVHHFRPRKPRARHTRQSSPSASSVDDHPESVVESDFPLHRNRNLQQPQLNAAISYSSKPGVLQSRKRKRSTPSVAEHGSEQTHRRPFSHWSRIKSGKSSFFDTLGTLGASQKNGGEGQSSGDDQALPNVRTQSPVESVKFDTLPVLAGSLSPHPKLAHPKLSPSTNEQSSSDEGKNDETIAWLDPVTREAFLLNARTGSVLPTRPLDDTMVRSRQSGLDDFNRPVRLQKKPAISGDQPTPWLNSVLETWNNPVFMPAKKGIKQVCHYEHQFDGSSHEHGGNFTFFRRHDGKDFEESSAVTVGKLSKTGLQNAQTIAQLDKKFILIKMQHPTSASSGLEISAEALVLVDQHAADERVQVEALLAELCTPLPKDHQHLGYRSKLGHQSKVSFVILEKPIQFAISSQERTHFVTHAAKFAAWGILFNVENPTTTPAQQQTTLSVMTLPTTVSERCKADPKALITFLRTAVWKYVDAPHSQFSTDDILTHSKERSSDSTLWVRRLSTCPEGLIDLINSRACRSAIMFNDELSLVECKELVRNLSKCVFPFMCAHGRPSMVPLVNLASVGEDGGAGLGLKETNELGIEHDFTWAWKKWKKVI